MSRLIGILKVFTFFCYVFVGSVLFYWGCAQAAVITGAGSTFSYPIYSKWADDYLKKTHVQMNYQAIGSGGGIKLVKERAVDFGASDVPLTKEILAQYDLIQWPMIMGGIVVSYNIPGVNAGALKLTPEALVGIYLGNIIKWNDPLIQKENPGIRLPDMRIIAVHRSEGSGTTFVFTNYLGKISQNWKENVGVAKAISWPSGIGGKGNAGVANLIKQTPGSIGYIEYAYAKQNHLPFALLKNHAGFFVTPNLSTFQAAAKSANWAEAKKDNFYLMLTDQGGKNAWPITGASFILFHKTWENVGQARVALQFFEWSLKNGDKSAMDLDYVPIPSSAHKAIMSAWYENIESFKHEKVLP